MRDINMLKSSLFAFGLLTSLLESLSAQVSQKVKLKLSPFPFPTNHTQLFYLLMNRVVKCENMSSDQKGRIRNICNFN